MKIWILAKSENFDNYENTRFRAVAAEMGIVLELLAPEDFEIIVTRRGRKSVFVRGEQVESLPDCFIPRTGSATTYFMHSIIRHLERVGVLVLNESHSIQVAQDKLATVQTLAAADIPTPKTMLAKMPLDLATVSREFTYPVIIKLATGSEGYGIVMCKTAEQLKDTIEIANPKKDMLQNIIIQECVKESLGKDIRAFVVGGRVIGAMKRKAPKGKFKANVSGGGSAERYELTPEIEWLAVESAKHLGLEIAGVDLLFSKEGFTICEVNSSPYFEGFEGATGIDVPRAIFNFISIRQHGWLAG